MATVVLKTRVDRSNARTARRVLAELGLKPSDAVNALFAQIASRKALPFALATADSSYAREEYGLSIQGVQEAGVRLRAELSKDRKAGAVRPASGISDLRE